MIYHLYPNRSVALTSASGIQIKASQHIEIAAAYFQYYKGIFPSLCLRAASCSLAVLLFAPNHIKITFRSREIVRTNFFTVESGAFRLDFT